LIFRAWQQVAAKCGAVFFMKIKHLERYFYFMTGVARAAVVPALPWISLPNCLGCAGQAG
jgi:hypothetical protein